MSSLFAFSNETRTHEGESTLSLAHLDNVFKVLDGLSVELNKSIIRGALRDSWRLMQAEVARTVPVGRTGALRESIRIRTSRRGGQFTIKLLVGNQRAWYAHIVEFGAKQHTINPRRKGGRLFIGKGLYASGPVEHPGVKEVGFMRRAFDSKATAAIKKFEDSLEKRVAKAVKKLSKYDRV